MSTRSSKSFGLREKHHEDAEASIVELKPGAGAGARRAAAASAGAGARGEAEDGRCLLAAT